MEEKCTVQLNRYSVWGIKRSSQKEKDKTKASVNECYLTDSEEENEKWGNKFGEIEQESSDDERKEKNKGIE